MTPILSPNPPSSRPHFCRTLCFQLLEARGHVIGLNFGGLRKPASASSKFIQSLQQHFRRLLITLDVVSTMKPPICIDSYHTAFLNASDRNPIRNSLKPPRTILKGPFPLLLPVSGRFRLAGRSHAPVGAGHSAYKSVAPAEFPEESTFGYEGLDPY